MTDHDAQRLLHIVREEDATAASDYGDDTEDAAFGIFVDERLIWQASVVVLSTLLGAAIVLASVLFFS